MSRYVRGESRWAADPVPGMRIYGRDGAGNLGRIVVHAVEAGKVYGAKRMRGWPCWTLCRWGLADWLEHQRGIVGVKLPRIERGAAS
jgi:hypothetical protein